MRQENYGFAKRLSATSNHQHSNNTIASSYITTILHQEHYTNKENTGHSWI